MLVHNADCKYTEKSWYDKNDRKQVVKHYKSKKQVKKAAKKAGLWNNKPEQHNQGDPYYHDRNHDVPSKPNMHYEY